MEDDQGSSVGAVYRAEYGILRPGAWAQEWDGRSGDGRFCECDEEI